MSSGISSVSATSASCGHQALAHEAANGVEQQVQRFTIADHVARCPVARNLRIPGNGQRWCADRQRDDAMTSESSTTSCELRRVAVVTLDNPPVNGLGHALRSAIVAARRSRECRRGGRRDRADGRPAKTFSAGADIREFNTPKSLAEPTLPWSSRTIEGERKPVIAAIGGTAMGGGLELALGLPLPRRQRRGVDRAARGEARVCCRAPAARNACRGLVGHRDRNDMIVTGATLTAAATVAAQPLFDASSTVTRWKRGSHFARKVVDEGTALQARAGGDGGEPRSRSDRRSQARRDSSLPREEH